jgi:hypothetical protein
MGEATLFKYSHGLNRADLPALLSNNKNCSNTERFQCLEQQCNIYCLLWSLNRRKSNLAISRPGRELLFWIKSHPSQLVMDKLFK